MWSDQEKRIQKIDHLARSLLFQGLSNDIYSLIDSNKTAKDLWDALARHMLGFEYGEQDRKAAVLYGYETFKATEGELLLDTYIRYLQDINDLKKFGYSKDNRELNFKFLNNLQPEWKQYATMMRQNKNLMNINIDALYNILKQNQGDVNDAMGSKKKTVVVTSDPLALIAEKIKVSKSKEKVVVSSDSKGSDADDFTELKKITALLEKAFNRRKFYSKPTNNNLRTSSTSQSTNKKQEFVKSDDKQVVTKDDEKKRDMSRVKCYNCKKEGHFVKNCNKFKVKDYEYYKTKMLLAKKDKDEQVLLAEDQAWMESSSDSDQEINANMVFMAQIEKVLSDSEASSSSADEKISELPAIRAALVAHPEAEWIWWLDEDTVITDMEYRIPFHKLIWDHGLPIFNKWAKILLEEFKHGPTDQTALAYLLWKEHYSWLGKKMLIETRYYLEGYWILIVDTLKNITKRYLEIEKSDRMLRRRHAEKVSETYGVLREPSLKDAGNEFGSWRRPFVTHFAGCQPCIGKRTRNPSFTLEGCKNAMDKALNFADNQVHKVYWIRP
nr:galactosyl transferase [Tanacetum cinerariifolium]